MSVKELNENTTFPFKIVAPIVSTLVVATWIMATRLTAIEAKLDSCWTVADQSRWADMGRKANTNIIIPYVSDVLKERK